MISSLKEPRVITFMGPVGVGKTTQIFLLDRYMGTRRMRVKRTYLKSSHGFVYILTKVLIRLGASDKILYAEGVSRTYPKRGIVKKLYSLWKLLDSASITIKFFFSVFLPFWLGYTVLIEEGLLMTLQTYNVIFPIIYKIDPQMPPFVKYLISWVSKKNGVYIILDAEYKELEIRRKSRSYRQSELKKFVILQRKWLNDLNQERLFRIETTGQSVLRVHESVVKVWKSFIINT
jgi:hypothetical protein